MSDIVQPGSYLTLHYRVALSGTGDVQASDVVNTFTDKPATLQLGQGQLAPALEEKLLGLKTGDHASFELAADEGFGARNPELLQKISRKLLNTESELNTDYQPGDVVEFNDASGARYAGVLKELTPQYALFDFNHPLAGQAVRFEVQIIGVL